MPTTKPGSVMPQQRRRKARKTRFTPATLLAAALPVAWSTLCVPAPAQGTVATPTETEKALERTEKALEQEQGLAPETKAALQELLRALRAERAGATQTPLVEPTKAPIATSDAPISEAPASSRFKVSGDFRLRH